MTALAATATFRAKLMEAQQPSSVGRPSVITGANLQQSLHRYLDAYQRANDFSGMLTITRHDSIIAQIASGYADRSRRVLNGMHTAFRVASVTKSFTGAAISLLIRDGTLRVTDTLGRYVPEYAAAANITIEQLLVHRSGVPELDSVPHPLSTPAFIALLQQRALLFKPGADERYSNEGYALLALVVERVSGIPFSQFVRQRILDPLGMTHSGEMLGVWPVRDHATGYVPGHGRDVMPQVPDEWTLVGAGSLYSTTPDLVRWADGILHRRVLDVWALRPYGWGTRTYLGHPLIEQSGQLEGYNSYVAVYPADSITVVFLSNIQSGMSNRVAEDMAGMLFGGPTSLPIVISPAVVARAVLREYDGTYRTPSIPIPMHLSTRGTNLFMRWGDYPFAHVLTPIGYDTAFYRSEYANIRFERDARGRVVRSVWKWEGGDPVVFVRDSTAH